MLYKWFPLVDEFRTLRWSLYEEEVGKLVFR
jgi:hypothetical protein